MRDDHQFALNLAGLTLVLDAVSLHNPLYVRESAKMFIQRATHNDSLFLSNLSTTLLLISNLL